MGGTVGRWRLFQWAVKLGRVELRKGTRQQKVQGTLLVGGTGASRERRKKEDAVGRWRRVGCCFNCLYVCGAGEKKKIEDARVQFGDTTRIIDMLLHLYYKLSHAADASRDHRHQ